MIAFVIVGAWLATGTGVALVIGRAVALADRRQQILVSPVSPVSKR